MPFNHNVVGCMSARRMILSNVFLSTTRGMLSQQGKIDLGTCSKLKLSRVAKEPATLNGNSRNREAVVAGGYNSEGATRRREGFERQGKQEKWHFYNIAKGSAGEVRSLTYVILDNNLAPCDAVLSLQSLASEVGAIIYGLMRSTKPPRVLNPPSVS